MPPTLARGQIPFQIVFSVWVTLSEHKWVTLAERRGSRAPCVFSQSDVAQRGLQPFANDAPVTESHFIDARVPVRADPIPNAVDYKHAHSGERQKTLAHPLVADCGRHHHDGVVLSSPRMRLDRAEADESLSRTALSHDGGSSTFLPAPRDPADRNRLRRVGLSAESIDLSRDRIAGAVERWEVLRYTFGHLTGVEAQVFVNILGQIVHTSAYLGGAAAVTCDHCERFSIETVSGAGIDPWHTPPSA